MARRLQLILLLVSLLAPATLRAAAKVPVRLRGGIEWGCSQHLWRHFHLNYLTEANARVDSQGSQWQPATGAQAGIYAGVLLSRSWEADLTAQYCGIWEDRRVFPVNLRLVHYFGSSDKDSLIKAFSQGGPVISNNFNMLPSWLVKGGIGRRKMLGERMSLDLSLSLQICFDHPEHNIYDPRHDYHVNQQKALRNNSTYASCCVDLSLNF